MAITLIEGFDTYNGTGTNTGLQANWTNVAGVSGSVSLTTGRFGGQALRSVGGNSTTNYRSFRTLPSAISQGTVGFAFRASSLGTTAPYIAWLLNSSSEFQLSLLLNTNGSISVGRATSASAATTLGTTAVSIISSNTWHYIELEFTISDTTGSINLYVDGVNRLSLTNVDTRNGTPTTVQTVALGHFHGGAANGFTWDFDDLYVTDTAARLGERRVETLRPAADTAQKDFARSAGSDNFALVDETLANGDTDYVQGSTVGNLDRYTIGALSSTPSAISAVQLTAFGLKTDAASRSIALHCRSGATDSDGPNYALAASYAKFDRILETDPATSAAWTTTGVNSLLIGPKVTV